MRWPRADLEEKQEPRAATSANAKRRAEGIRHDVTRKGLTEAAIEKQTFVQKHGAGHATRKSGRTRSFLSAVARRRVGHPRSWQPTETPPPTFDARLRGAYAQDVP